MAGMEEGHLRIPLRRLGMVQPIPIKTNPGQERIKAQQRANLLNRPIKKQLIKTKRQIKKTNAPFQGIRLFLLEFIKRGDHFPQVTVPSD
jgi:hypothetical protein